MFLYLKSLFFDTFFLDYCRYFPPPPPKKNRFQWDLLFFWPKEIKKEIFYGICSFFYIFPNFLVVVYVGDGLGTTNQKIGKYIKKNRKTTNPAQNFFFILIGTKKLQIPLEKKGAQGGGGGVKSAIVLFFSITKFLEGWVAFFVKKFTLHLSQGDIALKFAIFCEICETLNCSYLLIEGL